MLAMGQIAGRISQPLMAPVHFSAPALQLLGLIHTAHPECHPVSLLTFRDSFQPAVVTALNILVARGRVRSTLEANLLMSE